MAYPYIGDFNTGATIFFPFNTFDSNGASITLTGLAVTDIEVYKGASMTQRSSDAGYALVDTDGIDLDGVTGIHGFTIDTSDNTDAGFYAAGNDYTVVVSSVTIDTRTVNFIVGRFSILNRAANVTHFGGTAGTFASGIPSVNATQLSGDSTAADNAEAFFDGTGYAGTNNVMPTTTTVTNIVTANATQISGDSTAADNLEALLDGTLVGPYAAFGIIESGTAQSATATTLVGRAAGALANDTAIGATLAAYGSTQGYWQVRVITDVDLATDTFTVDTWTVTPSGTITYIMFASAPASTSLPMAVNVTQIAGSAVTATSGRPEVIVASTSAGAITSASIATGAIDADAIAAGAIVAATFAADVDAEILSYIVDDATRIDASALNTASVTTIPAILVDTGTTLDGLITTVDTVVDGIKAKTDSLTFTVAGKVDSNITHVIADPVITNGSTTTNWGGT